MPVGLYNQPQAHNAYQAAYGNPYAAYGQSNAESKNVYANSRQQASSVSISEQGQRLAQSDKSTIQTVEPPVLSSEARIATYKKDKLDAFYQSGLASCLETMGAHRGSCDGYKIRHDKMLEAIEKEQKAPPPCQTFELSVKKTAAQQTIVSPNLPSMSQFGFVHKDFSDYYHTHGNSYSLKIKEVAWQYTRYANDAEKQNVELRYAEPYTRQIVDRNNVEDISEDPVDRTQKFNHLRFGPGAGFMITHQLVRGDYPAKAPNTPATISVKYQYQTKSCHKPRIHDDL